MDGDERKCIICKEIVLNPTTVGTKGLKRLKRVCNERDLEELKEEIDSKIKEKQNVLVHGKCYRTFTDNRKSSSNPNKKLRSSVDDFDWKNQCFICGVLKDLRHPERNPVSIVSTLELKENVLECASQRNDEIGDTLKRRLLSCTDLVAEEGIYHPSCLSGVLLYKENKSNRIGRPVEDSKKSMFEKICQWLEEDGDSELYTMNELIDRFKTENTINYSPKYMKQLLQKRYGGAIYFAEVAGRSNVICFKEFANYILNEAKKKGEQTKEDIITAAAKIIKAEIREIPKSNNIYPTTEEIRDLDCEKQWIPESLQMLLSLLIPNNIKQVSIGQCVTQAARSRSLICPIPFGIGVQLDKEFGSKWLVNHLAKLGFSISPGEVLRYKQSAINHCSEQDDQPTFCQWAADNVDHNLVTLTGKGTFHGMGIVSMSNKPLSTTAQNIIRIKGRLKNTLFTNVHNIPIHQYHSTSIKGLAQISLKPVLELKKPLVLPTELSYDLLWYSLKIFQDFSKPTPNWSGFMQDLTQRNEAVPKSTISFLPIIDLDPNNEHCIFSTLIFIINQAKTMNIKVPCVTFDQPLWRKAVGIIEESKLSIVARLGGFHTVMSFLGAVGKLMKGSGLEELFCQVYAENSVEHMISGKAVSRALRAHLLAESCLTYLLFGEIDSEEQGIDGSTIKVFLEQINDKSIPMKEINQFCESEMMIKIEQRLEDKINGIEQRSRTAKLWLLYRHYIKLIKLYIIAERTSNWHLHIQTTLEMLNLFAACGRINYAKSARLYIQQMMSLRNFHPWLEDCFDDKKHAVNRSERYWGGLWSDLIIEQTLMRSIKTRGGLTRGRGMKESTRHLWVLSINHTAAVHEAMNHLSHSTIKTSEQHVDLGPSRMKRDVSDWMKFYDWLTNRNPFSYNDKNLHSLSSGFISILGEDGVNCEQAEEVGLKAQKMMNNLKFTDVTIKRKNQIKPLDSLTNTIKISQEKIYVNSLTLFTRLVAVAKRDSDEEKHFRFELTTEPMSLFKETMMRKPDKPSLRKAIVKEAEAIDVDMKDDDTRYVIDGGALLHRVCWLKGSTFKEIVNNFIKYIGKHYGSSHIVFDGYESQSTKDAEHARRCSKNQCPDIEVKEVNNVQVSQEKFLANKTNKSEFIKLLSHYLRNDGNTVINCPGDADTTICSTALKLALLSSEKKIVVVADDTDIFVMLVYHWQEDMDDIIFYQQRLHKGWSMNALNPTLKKIKSHILFVHAMSGCDTTSAPFGKGKKSFLHLVLKLKILQEISATFMDVWAEEEYIGQASIEAFIIMYGGNQNDSLTSLRHKKYLEMACKGLIEPAKLPPSERTAYYHGLRVHLQVVIWKVLDGSFELQPEHWGWQSKEGFLTPIMTDLEIAPDNLLQVIRCKCKDTSKNQCGTNLCSCRKHGLLCSVACGECQGQTCANPYCEQATQSSDDESKSDESDIEDEYEKNIFDLF